MSYSILVVDEHGKSQVEPVIDARSFFRRVVANGDGQGLHTLRYLDAYGDTVFNRLQIVPLLEDLEKLKAGASSPEDRDFVSSVEALARRCADEVHLYLKFVGD